MRELVCLLLACWAVDGWGQALHSAIERGRYLAAAGDCAACHTADGGKPYAGGRPVPTPFGTIYSTNITPDKQTGIGNWNEDQFYKAMHEGIRADGKHLYPAFPYPWYSKLSRGDVDAIKAFLEAVPPARQENKESELPWPLSVREVMSGWNAMFFKKGEYEPDPKQSAEWNRGAYLVEGPGHCGACHTPKNGAGAVKTRENLQGGYGENWYATSLTSDVRDGLGDWSLDDIVKYLKSGSNAKAAATGPMAEVVENSTQHLSEADLRAIGVYLKSVAGPAEAKAPASDQQRLARGAALYHDQCAGCHMEDGSGQAQVFPPLKANAVVQAKEPGTMLHMILDGARIASTATNPSALAMPAFGWKLSDEEAADLATYLRAAWGNKAAPVSASDVKKTRERMAKAAQTK
ncbi:MAG TPA: c-type cytochrome [Burkholderiales bacterium]|jgi:mono/diheme cytochrome c family protein